MLNKIQSEIITRLKQGLGSMVNEVSLYFGGLENKEVLTKIREKPAILLTFNQAQVKAKGSERLRFELSAGFYVVCICNRITDALPHPSANINDLVYAILRLLAGQRLNEELNSLGLQPKTVHPLFISPLDSNTENLDIVAIEFEAVCDMYGIESDHYPEYTTDINNPDYVFSLFTGKHSEAPAQFGSLVLSIENKSIQN
ncbi:phage protein Gp37 [Snodgrassella gandavensis]|uniref:phage protein Gp37 n=1 Tax=Snodgrassella gandavensis TaxID=2946698 RepID=UPI0023B2F0AC|nr:phage protein Gp37 [Snodgrassella gandavensis]